MTETSTLTLSEFLLARWDEDEADARALTYNWNSSHEALRRRFVGDIEAKRRIVERCVDRMESGEDDDGNLMTSGAHLGDEVMRELALPYVDHPDYREEWKL